MLDILKILEVKIKLEVLKEKKGFFGVGGSIFYKVSFNIDLVIEGK